MKKPNLLNFKILGDHIELIRLLKAVNLVESGGHAKQVVDEGLVKVNGSPESRKRAKLKAGDQVHFGSYIIVLE